MPVTRPLHRRGLFPALALASALALSACGGDGAAPECTLASECPRPAGACLAAACLGGACGFTPLDAGAVVGVGTPGDCQHDVCDGRGAVVSAADDADLPSDGNACTLESCDGGQPRRADAPPGDFCAQDGGTLCDGAGRCVQCLVAFNCPGTDAECGARTCAAGVCGRSDAPLGTPLVVQVEGNCVLEVCDGFGATTTQPLAPRTACTEDGGALCDGAGRCQQCLAPSDCPGADGPCQQRTCGTGACGLARADAGTPVANPVAGDCQQDVCDGAGVVVTVPYDAEVPDDGNQCTVDACQQGTPAHPPAGPGTACAQSGGALCDGAGACVGCLAAADCDSGVCADRTCQAPTCADAVRNGGESDVDCGGATACPRCAPSRVCLAAADCQSGVCTGGRCAAPSCGDAVKNGAETDVDCGGLCPACAVGQACLAALDCASRDCLPDHTCGPPRVVGVSPADGATAAVPGTVVTLFLTTNASAASATVQPTAGPCTGALQLSADDFTTCLGASRTVNQFAPLVSEVVLQPAVPLAPGVTYKVRSTAALTSLSRPTAFEPFAMATGFRVADGGGCGPAVVISQVYPGGGAPGALFARDFVELHNRSAAAIDLAGLSIQAAAAASNAWAVTPLAGSLRPGGYLLVQLGGAGGQGAPIPAPDLSGTTDLPAVGGTVALASTTARFATTACPAVGLLDAVGWGDSGSPGFLPATCFEGAAPAAAPPDAGAALVRAGAGCADGNGSALDFGAQLAVPRNAGATSVPCGCAGSAVNETNLTVEMDFCNVQSPASLSPPSGTIAGPVWGRVFEAGVTEAAGAPPGLVAQLGYGPGGTDPRFAPGWTFVDASFDVQVGNDDEFQASFTAPAPGTYAYAFRFSPDGARWTYCDPDGAGANAGLIFEPAALPPLVVTP